MTESQSCERPSTHRNSLNHSNTPIPECVYFCYPHWREGCVLVHSVLLFIFQPLLRGRTVVGSFSGAVVSIDLHVFLINKRGGGRGTVQYMGTNVTYGDWK